MMAKPQIPQEGIHHDSNRLGQSFKQRLTSGDPLLGGIVVEYLRPSLIKLYRQAGFDFIYVENEHALFSPPRLCDFVLAARDNNMPTIIKTPDLCRADVARLLDAGAVGIQLPRTESRQDIEVLNDLMKFPPVGSRAGAPCFGNVDYIAPTDGGAWIKGADAATVTVAHIETCKGYENAEEIISTPAVDMVYVGPYDLSISLGYPGQYDHQVVRDAILDILDLCVKHKVPFGTTASIEGAAEYIQRGCRFFEIIDEHSLIVDSAKHIVSQYRTLGVLSA